MEEQFTAAVQYEYTEGTVQCARSVGRHFFHGAFCLIKGVDQHNLLFNCGVRFGIHFVCSTKPFIHSENIGLSFQCSAASSRAVASLSVFQSPLTPRKRGAVPVMHKRRAFKISSCGLLDTNTLRLSSPVLSFLSLVAGFHSKSALLARETHLWASIMVAHKPVASCNLDSARDFDFIA